MSYRYLLLVGLGNVGGDHVADLVAEREHGAGAVQRLVEEALEHGVLLAGLEEGRARRSQVVQVRLQIKKKKAEWLRMLTETHRCRIGETSVVEPHLDPKTFLP